MLKCYQSISQLISCIFPKYSNEFDVIRRLVCMRFGEWGPFAEGGISAQLQKTRLCFAAGASLSENQLYRHRGRSSERWSKSGDNGKWRRMQKGEPILIFGRWLIQKDTKPSLSCVDTKVTKRGRNSDSTDKKIGSRFYIQKQMSDLDLRHQIFVSTAGEPTSRRETGNLILSHILMRKIPKSRFMNFGGSVKICSY